MVTYLYWFLVVALIFAVLFGIGARLNKWKPALVASLIILIASSGFYYFWLQQILVKRYGGRMSISVPAGQLHMHSTWKDDNLWIENYDPEKNECIFSEYSRGSLLEGRVIIKNCNPLMLHRDNPPSEQP